MELGLRHKRALVTGSSAGLGRAIAEMLAAEGASVVVHGRDADRTQAVVSAIGANGGEAVAVLGDLSTDEGAAAVAHAAGEIDNPEIAGLLPKLQTGFTHAADALGAIASGDLTQLAALQSATAGIQESFAAFAKLCPSP